MATRFGAVSPAQTYATKVRWLIGCLVAVILVLVALLIVLGGASPDPAPEQLAGQTNVLPAHASQAQAEDVVVAVQRIEESSRIEPFMVEVQKRPLQDIPRGAVRGYEVNTVIGKKFTQRLINAQQPLIWEDLSDSRPISPINIPPGFRAVTILVDDRTGIEGWAKPNTRVDVLWTYTDRDNKKKVATIVRFTRILSVGGMHDTAEGRATIAGQTTVTLLVAEEDAKKIELARNLGSLTLSLVGDKEQPLVGDSPRVVDIDTILGTPRDLAVTEEPADGVMYTKDPNSGKMVRYVLRRGRWTLDANN